MKSVDNDYRDQLLISVNKDMGIVMTCIREIQKDLKEHMKRTHQNEVYIRTLESRQINDKAYVMKHIFAIQVLFGSVGIVGAIIGILFRFGVL